MLDSRGKRELTKIRRLESEQLTKDKTNAKIAQIVQCVLSDLAFD